MGRRTRWWPVAAALGLAVAGCTPDHGPTEGPPPPPSPDATSATAGAGPLAIGPSDEDEEAYRQTWLRCLRDRGWETTVHADGSFSTQVPDDQDDVYHADFEDCQEEAGVHLPPLEVTPKYAGAVYDRLLEVAECVRDLGYHVPDPPSRQAFVDALVAYPIPAWHPYNSAYEAGGPGSQQRVETECPVE
jgi:hypothetical protein